MRLLGALYDNPGRSNGRGSTFAFLKLTALCDKSGYLGDSVPDNNPIFRRATDLNLMQLQLFVPKYGSTKSPHSLL